jgi:transposase
VIFVGIDWSERHHDVCVMDPEGRVLGKGRVPDGVEGLARMHEMVAAHAGEPSQVVVGIEIDRGLLVGALVGAGYAVHAVNPLSVDRYRGPSPGLGRQVRPGRCEGPGRSGPHRPAPASTGGRGHRAG